MASASLLLLPWWGQGFSGGCDMTMYDGIGVEVGTPAVLVSFAVDNGRLARACDAIYSYRSVAKALGHCLWLYGCGRLARVELPVCS